MPSGKAHFFGLMEVPPTPFAVPQKRTDTDGCAGPFGCLDARGLSETLQQRPEGGKPAVGLPASAGRARALHARGRWSVALTTAASVVTVATH